MENLFLKKSIPELLTAVQRNEITFGDMADLVARTIEARESETRAWVRYDLQSLRAAADAAYLEYRRRGGFLGLDGIPFGVKDIFNTRAFPTEMGSEIWKDFTPGNNARVVDSLLFAGGLVAGKTVTAEFAVHALNETRNPHDPERTPGTSSSGSAAAVATGMVPYALGSQTAGSITRPASFCGVWGFKPSFGLIPRTGVLKTTDSLDTIGFLAAHGTSLRPILDCTRVHGPDYPFVYRNVDQRGPFPKTKGAPWRIGFVKTHTWDAAADYARAAVEKLAGRIGGERDFELTEIGWPDELCDTHEVHSTIYSKSLSYYFQNEAKMGERMSAIMSEMIADGESISRQSFTAALRRQERIAETVARIFEPFDLVLSLGTSSAAPLRGETELPDPSLIWTMTHVPAVSVPLFRSPEGLPFAAQFVSRRWNDYSLLQGIEELVDRAVLPSGSTEICPA